MSAYIVKRRSTILKKQYLPGETIPKDAIPSDLVAALKKHGYITDINGNDAENSAATAAQNAAEPSKIVIPINDKEGVLELSMTPEDIITAIKALQLNAENAAKAVGAIEKEEILILIDALDTRKTVKAAIEEKVKAMKGGGEDKGKGDA